MLSNHQQCGSDAVTLWASWIEVIGIRAMRSDQLEFETDLANFAINYRTVRPHMPEYGTVL